ncbi:Histidine kinase-, DNA gyrase B-, and HSP90-like ATPase [Robiginitalea myxolifaciens]|uniref:Histidine kinase-, DNA gyrase B-, and HSP90-like ATPase n=1 Tax=Robiginitalea myxolifaciens TaxID=400055 RepID=A0A1I6HFC0_9FLAO|nr:histidine kinase [Robiginitalea myxolifaciens]SFR53040.1 Histidine kinase-, DNA gyrase B-, and HSP90-like ATPase [Robiginitalea myxolifaciens]
MAFQFQKIRSKEVLWILVFYMGFAFLYHITLKINAYGWDVPIFEQILSPARFWRTSGRHYLIFFLASIPIWYLVFVRLKHWSLLKRIGIHLIALPIFVIGTQQFYYWMGDLTGYGYLQGQAQVWDLYIPALFYLIQFGIFHAYEHYRENQRKLIVEGELRQAALKSELAAIKAQLNPHFLYNVFNTINASVPAENEQTRQMIAQLSDLFRYQLRASQQDLVPLQDELEFVSKYLDLEKARFGDRLEIEIEVPDELLEEKIPPMLLQPLVENSIKHGLASLIDGGKIGIRIWKAEDKLRFEISDTGVGLKDKEAAFSQGIGLKNTAARLAKRYQTAIELLDNEPQGLTIRFAL